MYIALALYRITKEKPPQKHQKGKIRPKITRADKTDPKTAPKIPKIQIITHIITETSKSKCTQSSEKSEKSGRKTSLTRFSPENSRQYTLWETEKRKNEAFRCTFSV